jgi:hypothetical protein
VRRFLLRSLVVGGAVAGAVAPLRRDRAARRALEHGGDRVAKRARYYRGVASGAWYRIRGRRPDPVVGDDVLRQRVLSALGPVEKHRDLPRVHVMVEQGFVILRRRRARAVCVPGGHRHGEREDTGMGSGRTGLTSSSVGRTRTARR